MPSQRNELCKFSSSLFSSRHRYFITIECFSLTNWPVCDHWNLFHHSHSLLILPTYLQDIACYQRPLLQFVENKVKFTYDECPSQRSWDFIVIQAFTSFLKQFCKSLMLSIIIYRRHGCSFLGGINPKNTATFFDLSHDTQRTATLF